MNKDLQTISKNLGLTFVAENSLDVTNIAGSLIIEELSKLGYSQSALLKMKYNATNRPSLMFKNGKLSQVG
jgi:hypothetical protein